MEMQIISKVVLAIKTFLYSKVTRMEYIKPALCFGPRYSGSFLLTPTFSPALGWLIPCGTAE